MTTVSRPDLSKRTALSKSALVGYDLCATKAWYSIHDPRPFVPNEKVTFGSAVDAGVEVILKYVRSGQDPDLGQATAAAEFVIECDGTEVDIHDVQTALAAFLPLVPRYDWSYCQLQADLTADLDGLGETNGHPDIILRDGRVIDIKTASRAKPDEPSVELGLYALLVEAATGQAVPAVGYLTWVRVARPYWQPLEFAVTDEYRRWTYERAAAFVRAKKADELLNRKAETPANWTFGSGPKFPSLCSDCEYNPVNGGPCVMARREEAA
jgi:hypothetical protein